jgi:hypothetical protein
MMGLKILSLWFTVLHNPSASKLLPGVAAAAAGVYVTKPTDNPS